MHFIKGKTKDWSTISKPNQYPSEDAAKAQLICKSTDIRVVPFVFQQYPQPQYTHMSSTLNFLSPNFTRQSKSDQKVRRLCFTAPDTYHTQAYACSPLHTLRRVLVILFLIYSIFFRIKLNYTYHRPIIVSCTDTKNKLIILDLAVRKKKKHQHFVPCVAYDRHINHN